MGNSILVKVTQKNIDDASNKIVGERAIDLDPLGSCIVALAIKDIWPGASVSVGFTTAVINMDKEVAYSFPKYVVDKIKDFVAMQKVDPFEFEMTKLGNISI